MHSNNYFDWSDTAKLKISLDNKAALISGNKEGLIFLGEYLIRLAELNEGTHMHLDDFNVLEQDSPELIIEKLAE